MEDLKTKESKKEKGSLLNLKPEKKFEKLLKEFFPNARSFKLIYYSENRKGLFGKSKFQTTKQNKINF